MKFEPLLDMVLVRTVVAPEKSEGGIIIPEGSRNKPDEGIIISKGPDCEDVPGIGDRVIFGKYVGLELNIPGVGDNVLLLHQSDIYGRITK